MSTPGPKTRSTSPTVFEQHREELVREIAVVRKLRVTLMR
jgi:DASH complex subunit DAD1